MNRYREPIFRGYSIGCERCHGPAELHVRGRLAGEITASEDATIVNPGRLEPALRDAVCEQCHLQGQQRVLRRGLQAFDYRPGLPFHWFWSVFTDSQGREHGRIVGHVEEMQESRCFRATSGKLGCISCHDPHRLPAPSERVGYYRQRCLTCHQEQSCSLPPATRRVQEPRDSCIACHMPGAQSVDVNHMTLTDHRIPRKPGQASAAPVPPLGPRDQLTTYFYRGRVPEGDPEVERDRGVAIMNMARSRAEGAENQLEVVRARMAQAALPLLEAAVRHAPDDIVARESKGYAHLKTGDKAAAWAEFQTAVAQVPQRQQTLTAAADLAEDRGRPDLALAYYERLRAINPWAREYHFHYARLLALRGEWAKGAEAARTARRLNPADGYIRMLLIDCLVKTGQTAEAKAEFENLLLMSPNPDALRRWFAQLR